MGYAVLDPDELEPWDHPDRESTLRPIGAAAELSTLGTNLYEAEPGEQLPLAYHSHEEQEELFYVCSGTLAVETPEETLTVEAGEVFVAEPESPHRAFVDEDTAGASSGEPSVADAPEDAAEPVRALAVGAPSVDDVQCYEASSDDSSEA